MGGWVGGLGIGWIRWMFSLGDGWMGGWVGGSLLAYPIVAGVHGPHAPCLLCGGGAGGGGGGPRREEPILENITARRGGGLEPRRGFQGKEGGERSPLHGWLCVWREGGRDVGGWVGGWMGCGWMDVPFGRPPSGSRPSRPGSGPGLPWLLSRASLFFFCSGCFGLLGGAWPALPPPLPFWFVSGPRSLHSSSAWIKSRRGTVDHALLSRLVF